MQDARLIQEDQKKVFFEKQALRIDKVLPKLVKKTERRLRKGKVPSATAVVTVRLGLVTYVKSVDIDERFRMDDEVLRWIVSYTDGQLNKMRSPFRASFLKSYRTSLGILPNVLMISMPTTA